MSASPVPGLPLIDPEGLIADVELGLVVRPCGRILVGVRVDRVGMFERLFGMLLGVSQEQPVPSLRITPACMADASTRLLICCPLPSRPKPVPLAYSIPLHPAARRIMSFLAVYGVVDFDILGFEISEVPLTHQPADRIELIPCVAVLDDPTGHFHSRLRASEAEFWPDPRAKDIR